MYYKNKLPTSIRWGVPYSCGCAIRKDSFGKQLYFGEDYCTQGFRKRLLDAIRAGEFGKSWQSLLCKYPTGTVDSKLALYACDKCGYWTNEERLDFYIPVKGEIPVSQDLEVLKNNGKYRLHKKYLHLCPNCKDEMREILNSRAAIQEAHLICPKCHREISVDSSNWVADMEQEYHGALLAMFAQSFLFESNDMLISHLADNVRLISPNENIAIAGIPDVKKYLIDY